MARRMTVVFDDEELYTAVKVEAARRHMPAKDIVADALRQWLELQEDMDDVRVAEERLADYERTGEYVSHEEVMRSLGLKPKARTA
jgi:predicted transcriptional regulator